MKTIFSLVFGIFFLSTHAQTTNDNLNAQLNEMKTSFLNSEYEVIVKYTFPKVVEMMGGEEAMLKTTGETMDQMKAGGFSFLDISFSDPSAFLEQNGFSQCTLNQILVMDTPQGKMESTTTLMAVSGDDGQNWSFLDASGVPENLISTIFPDIHPDIVPIQTVIPIVQIVVVE